MTATVSKAAVTKARNAIAALIETDTAKRAELASGAQGRMKAYRAHFATDAFAEFAVANAINLPRLFGRCDKTIDRFSRVVKCLQAGHLALADGRDMNRFTFKHARNVIASHAKGAVYSKTDIVATRDKADQTRAEHLMASARSMSVLTDDRQDGIALFVLADLGLIERGETIDRNGKKETPVKVIESSPAYRLFCDLIAAGH